MKYEEIDTQIARIESAQDCWLKSCQDKAYYQKIEELMLKNYVYQIRRYYTRWDCRLPQIHEAITEIGKKYKRDRKNLTQIENFIQNDLFKGKKEYKVKISKHMIGGYEGYYEALIFKAKDREFTFQIPVREKITIDNFEYASYGKFVIYDNSKESYRKVICSDWDPDELADKLDEYLNNNEEEK